MAATRSREPAPHFEITDAVLANPTSSRCTRARSMMYTVPAAGVGTVRAKTGSLSGVTTLAGTVTTIEGRLLAFAVLADQVPATGSSRRAVDGIASALAACGCR